MKTPQEYFSEMAEGKQTASRWISIIEKAQKEAKAEGIREMFAALNGFFNALEKDKKRLLNEVHKKRDLVQIDK